MSLPEHLAALQDAASYPHECDRIALVETHISWVLLTGPFAYKLKKPVRLPFLDFGTLERRRYFCEEELRCNRAFAPELYRDVVPVARGAAGLRIEGDGPVVEWAVRMRQFPTGAQLDRLLDAGDLEAAALREFGTTLARQHRAQPALEPGASEFVERVSAPMDANFSALDELDSAAAHKAQLARVRDATRAELRRHQALLEERLEDGSLRECHGDLHLSNLVRLDDAIRAFDCIEFDPLLRWIDTWSDLGFLFMDCLVRGRADLGHAFVDGYLDESGDYRGAVLLPLYAAYRSMVRAKVAALRHQQQPDEQELARFTRHLDWAEQRLRRRPGRLVLMCGLSGSGKSWLATRLVERLPALRFRSDVARKRAAGLEPHAHSGSGVGTGLYTAAHGDAAYALLLEVTEALLASGDTVVVDAAFLRAAQRAPFLELARRLHASATILQCDAPEARLRERLVARAEAGTDPSEADLAVLDHQLGIFERPAAPEPVMRVATGEPLDAPALEAIVDELAGPVA